eukprot:417181-Rhodomonas_salina.1
MEATDPPKVIAVRWVAAPMMVGRAQTIAVMDVHTEASHAVMPVRTPMLMVCALTLDAFPPIWSASIGRDLVNLPTFAVDNALRRERARRSNDMAADRLCDCPIVNATAKLAPCPTDTPQTIDDSETQVVASHPEPPERDALERSAIPYPPPSTETNVDGQTTAFAAKPLARVKESNEKLSETLADRVDVNTMESPVDDTKEDLHIRLVDDPHLVASHPVPPTRPAQLPHSNPSPAPTNVSDEVGDAMFIVVVPLIMGPSTDHASVTLAVS